MNNTTISAIVVEKAKPWEQLLQASFYTFLLGLVTSSMSLAICVGIAKSKKLRNRFFVTIGFLTFCRALLGLQYLFVGVYRIFRTLGFTLGLTTRLACHTLHFWIMCGSTLEMCLLLLLVLDRALAIIAPLYYRSLTPRQAAYACSVVSISVCLVTLSQSYANVDLMEVVTCISSYSPTSARFNEFTQTIDFVVVVLVVVAYFALMLGVYWKVRKMKTTNVVDSNSGTQQQASAARVQLKRQLKLMPVLRNLVLSHCGISLLARIMLFLVAFAPTQASRLGLYGGVLIAIDEFLNVVMLLCMNKELRAASTLFCCKKQSSTNQISTMHRNNMRTLPPVEKSGI